MIFIVLGTMSEIIKFSPVIRYFKKKKIPFKVVHTGQNPDSLKLFSHLMLDPPDFVLKPSFRKKWVKRGKFGSLLLGFFWVVKFFKEFYSLLKKEKPIFVFYQGDCITVPFTALASKLAGVRTSHKESGMRSTHLFNPFPEEISRRVGDYLGDVLFVPAKEAEKNLNKYKTKKIIYTGEGQEENLSFVLKIKPSVSFSGKYFVVNLHRFENINSKNKMNSFFEVLKKSPFKIIFPINLNTKNKLRKFGLLDKISKLEGVQLIDPLDYIDFVHLMKNSQGIITDSGGVQVEASVLNVPCIVFRDHANEWIETIRQGFTIPSTSSKLILNYLFDVKNKGIFYKKVKTAKPPYGGKPSEKIANFFKDFFNL